MDRFPAAAVAIALVLAGCAGGSGRSDGDPLRVVAAENVWGNITAQIGGDRVEVRSLINDAEEDPHLYQSSARDAAAVSRADIVIVNGLGYDDFASRLLDTGGRHGRVVVRAESFKRGSNPHLWYDVAVVDSIADAIYNALAARDPADKILFAQNRDRFTESLRPVLEVRDEIARKFADAPVAYTERVPEYLLEQAGLKIVSPPGFSRAIEDGNEPDARDTQRMDDLISQRGARVLCYNPQATSAVTEAVRSRAHATGIPIVAMTETLPKGTSYQDWQRQQLRSLLAALEQSQ